MYPTNHIAYSINLGKFSDISDDTVEMIWNTLTDEQKATAITANYENVNGNWKAYTEDDTDFVMLLNHIFFESTAHHLYSHPTAGVDQNDLVVTVGEEFENTEDILFDNLPDLDPKTKQAFDALFEEFFPGIQTGFRAFITWC